MKDLISIHQFFKDYYTIYASYNASIKLAHICDGLKTSGRKILYTCISQNIKSKKLGQLANATSDLTNYLHGEQSLVGVGAGLAQRFTGNNNLPLLKDDGSFGSRLLPNPAAPRYIFTGKEDYIDILFNPYDNTILEEQIFEGDKIEPKYYIPILPMLLINGSLGLAIGFSQNILPRNPEDIIKYINRKLAGQNSTNELLPYWKGFKGKIVQKETGSFDIYGCVELSKGRGIITEIPIGIEYKKYNIILDGLVNSGILLNYNDKCDTYTDEILYELKFNPVVYQDIISGKLDVYDVLKLKNTEVENYTCIDQQGDIKVYNSVFEILDEYIKIRLEFYQKRKDFLLNKFNDEIKLLCSKYIFIKGVIDETIKVNNISVDKIIKQLEEIPNIIKIEDSYNYLLKMSIHSLTKEKIDDLKIKIKDLKTQLDNLQNKSVNDLWKEDISNIKHKLYKTV